MTAKTAHRIAAAAPAVLVAALAWLAVGVVHGQAPGVLAKVPAWQPANPDEVRREVFAWLDRQQPDQSVRAAAAALWPAGEDGLAGRELLERLAQTFALADENARQLVDLCAAPRQDLSLPKTSWLTDPQTPALMANNMRLWYGRWLAHQALFDESLEQLSGLRPQDVVDPASLLFYQAVVYDRLLDREAGLAAIGELLAGARQSPARYVAVARLMQADLEELEEGTLDHIARRMEDIERRLDLGRTGPRVRKIEDGVVESLDKLVEELEQKQQQASSGGNNLRSSSPAQDSRILTGKGPGEVTKRDIGSAGGWGNLPPKERQQAMQQIGREFPSYYRDAIEQYFRKLAGQQSGGE